HAASMSVAIWVAPVVKLGMSCATGAGRHWYKGLGEAGAGTMYCDQNVPWGTALLVSEAPNNCFAIVFGRPAGWARRLRMLSERSKPCGAGVPLMASVQGVGVLAPAAWYASSMIAASPPLEPPIE